MLKTRVITAIIGFIIALGAITLGGITYDFIILLLTLAGWREFLFLCAQRRLRVPALWGYIGITAIMIAVMMSQLAAAVLLCMLSIFALYILFTFGVGRFTLSGTGCGLFGMVYILSGMSSLLIIRHNDLYSFFTMPFELVNWGVIVLWLLLFTTWASDTFAYFTGRAWGRHHIVPQISPNKTLEGFVGGFAGAVVTGAVYSLIVGIPLWMGVHFGIFIGILAPLGDLFESKIKRICQVKDSGVLLPGHGGVLDRFDSLLFTAPAVLLYLLFML